MTQYRRVKEKSLRFILIHFEFDTLSGVVSVDNILYLCRASKHDACFIQFTPIALLCCRGAFVSVVSFPTSLLLDDDTDNNRQVVFLSVQKYFADLRR